MGTQISVITPTIRTDGLSALHISLAEQTFNDFEWLVEIGFPHRGCDLSRALNRMLKRAKGELIVILQDHIRIQPNGLELFFNEWRRNKNRFFTAPVGKRGRREIVWDWRVEGDNRIINPAEWEMDWACAPKKAFYDVGGFDERYDNGWSWENAELAVRASMAGYSFLVLPKNEAVAYDHDKYAKHPFRGKNENKKRFQETLRKTTKQNYKLNYLKGEQTYPI